MAGKMVKISICGLLIRDVPNGKSAFTIDKDKERAKEANQRKNAIEKKTLEMRVIIVRKETTRDRRQMTPATNNSLETRHSYRRGSANDRTTPC
ncbi:hypothetical protein MAR_017433 [Mya arenaria]|uniref:Uncharacterized protein n=1 Tax=Mya arenaria TaxID=6604 RepID=A0ABY7EBR2_MYAAR|nr:hypothetical protein MAR_017433 [Mya arenaria]